MANPERKGESGDAPREAPDAEHLSTQLSALLLELVRTRDVPAEPGWSPEIRPGGTVGRFELLRELGRGGFGLVYEAVDGDLGRTVALKVIKPGTRVAARGREWLQREAEAVARLNHPNIVTLHDFGQAAAGPYLVFELLRGRSLAERMRSTPLRSDARMRGGPLPFDDVLEIAIAVSRALVHAHDAGVVHRDLTPGNVHLGEDGSIKVLDFGLAHLFGRDGASDGGTPAYMAPEQWHGDESDARTDLFALGVILHQALTGAVPYAVEKGWSEALEPGPVPGLPRRAAPAAFRRVVSRCLEREPERRPASARAVRDALLAVRRRRQGRVRRLVLGGATAVATAALAAAGWLWLNREPPAGEQVKVVLAGVENAAGMRELEALPGLLRTALSPSPRVKLVPASRLAALSREAGLGELGPVDAARGRDLARLAGASVLLVPTSWREDGAASLAVRAVESETGRVLFTVRAPLPSVEALAPAVDRLAAQIRNELRERSADQKLRRPVAELVTQVPEAARLYYEGLDCLLRVQGQFEQCAAPFERALAQDPGFALAHYQLAMIRSPRGATPEMYQVHLRAALSAVDRLPPSQATLVRALSARLAGDLGLAARLYEQVLARDPEDVDGLSGMVIVRIEQQAWPDVVPFAEKLTRLFPETEENYLVLIEALGRADRRAELRALAQGLEARGPTSGLTFALVQAYCWLGDASAARAAARRGVEVRGDAELAALRSALYFAGAFEEMEAVARREAAAHPDDPWRRSHVATALAGQGRLREALREADAIRAVEQRSDAGSGLFRGAMLAAATRDPRQVLRPAAMLTEIDPPHAAELGIVLLLLGDVEDGVKLGKGLTPGSPEALQFEALRAWRAGDLRGALSRLAAAEEKDPFPVRGLSPAYLAAEVSAAVGDDGAVLAAIARFRRLPPRGFWRSWALPRTLYLAGRAHLRMGEREAGRAELRQLLSTYASADPDAPLLSEARALAGAR